VYLTGYSYSVNFPAVGALQGTDKGGGADMFVAVLNPALGADALTFSTLLGGVNSDAGYGITVGPDGMIYAVGTTGSKDFPVTANAVYVVQGGITDAVVVKVNPAANLRPATP
jgi:hypothetical protein